MQELFQNILLELRPETSKKTVRQVIPEPVLLSEKDNLTQDFFWQTMQFFLRQGDVLVVENGTSSAGAGSMVLPPDCTYIAQPVWGSIGYSLGALLGTLLAAPERRQLLFIGDGSFQLTAQELSTILHLDLKPYIFLINNAGYTIERTILGKNAQYNNIANWSYADLPGVLCPDSTAETYVVSTVAELREVLDTPHKGLVFVEILLDKDDAPINLIKGGHATSHIDYGPRGPQFADNARIPLPKAVISTEAII
jgi:indolepyruvate decarboxylase